MSRVFLTAEWRWLAMLNYEVSPALLRPLVPAGTEIDLWNGKAYVSIVAFLFLNTRVQGIPIPFHRNFEELNLRFYVRREHPDGPRRGVVFVKEVVPRFAIAAVARYVYNENYVARRMSSRIDVPPSSQAGVAEYRWRDRGRWSRVTLETGGSPNVPGVGSEAEFITEHYWGYARQRDGTTMEYRVEHATWRVWSAASVDLDTDFTSLYGARFGESLRGSPASAFLAEGSPVVVRRGTRIES